jgi:hypothetical protein
VAKTNGFNVYLPNSSVLKPRDFGLSPCLHGVGVVRPEGTTLLSCQASSAGTRIPAVVTGLGWGSEVRLTGFKFDSTSCVTLTK